MLLPVVQSLLSVIPLRICAVGPIPSKLALRQLAVHPEPKIASDPALVDALKSLGQVIKEAAEPSCWDYARDGSSVVIALVGVVVAVMLFRSQRKQQLRDTRLAWIRLFIIEPQSEFILKFFGALEADLSQINQADVLQQSATIVAHINTSFNGFDKRFLSYTDSIEGSLIPVQLRKQTEDLRDELADLIDKFDITNPAGEIRKLVERAVLGRNKFLATLYSLSFS